MWQTSRSAQEGSESSTNMALRAESLQGEVDPPVILSLVLGLKEHDLPDLAYVPQVGPPAPFCILLFTSWNHSNILSLSKFSSVKSILDWSSPSWFPEVFAPVESNITLESTCAAVCILMWMYLLSQSILHFTLSPTCSPIWSTSWEIVSLNFPT